MVFFKFGLYKFGLAGAAAPIQTQGVREVSFMFHKQKLKNKMSKKWEALALKVQ